ncbi:hypothetical protein CMI47_06110 [Candidatus Pacearchaeota archaeon]|jgi:PKD repeat protein|nr:hypothetical protein [Candidatus Pacearchaeota archaeon]|tara:strand:+ start:2051 stop:2476 length:426 start_codon:yes stop_codon:yes gene_type:complete
MAKIEGIVPFTVNFTDKSVGDNLTYSWDFGDGGFSEGQSPTYTYNSIGEYKVQLTVTNGYGSNSASNTVMVNKEDTKGDDKEGNGNGKNGKNGGNGKKGGNGKNGGNGKGGNGNGKGGNGNGKGGNGNGYKGNGNGKGGNK